MGYMLGGNKKAASEHSNFLKKFGLNRRV